MYNLEKVITEYMYSILTSPPLTFQNFLLAGFEKPSAIQQRAIKPIVKGRDVIAQYVHVIFFLNFIHLAGSSERISLSMDICATKSELSWSAYKPIRMLFYLLICVKEENWNYLVLQKATSI